MAEPFIYTPTYSYSGYQASNPTRPLPAPKVDNDFAKISQSTSEIALALRDIRRSDGKLQNGLVTIQSLETSLSALIAAVPGLAAAAAVSATAAAASAGSAAVSAAAASASAGVATAAAQRALENATGLVIATQAQAEAGVLNDKGMTPLRTKQQIDTRVQPASQSQAEIGTDNFAFLTSLRTRQAVDARVTDARLAELLNGASWSTLLSLSVVLNKIQTGEIAYDIYLDSVNGDDNFSGRSPYQPRKTLQNIALQNNLKVGLKRGSLFRSPIELLTGNYKGVHFGPYGVGEPPKIWGSERHTSGWSAVSGGTYSKAIGRVAVNAFSVAADGSVTKYILGTYGSLSAGQFAVGGTNNFTVQINAGGTDPNTLIIEIPQAGDANTGNGFRSGNDDVSITGCDLWFFPWNGVEFAATGKRPSVTYCSVCYNGNDGIGGHETITDAYVGGNFIKRNGRQRSTSVSAGDGVSFHDLCQGVISGNVIVDNEKSAIANIYSTSFRAEYNFMRNNNREFIVLGGAGYEGRPGGVHVLAYNMLVWTSTNSTVSGEGPIMGTITDASSPAVVKVFNNTIYRESGSSTTAGVRVQDSQFEVKNNIIANFARGIDYRGSDIGTLVNDYNCMFNNTTNYFNNGNPGVQPGTHDVLTNPLFVDASKSAFGLQASSPCINAGISVGEVRDYAGIPVSGLPDIGAFERAA